MTVQEAIKHCEEKAKEKYAEGMLCHANPNDDLLDGCIKCAKEHEQLAEWLKELEQYRALGTVEELKDEKKLLEKLEELKFANEERGYDTAKDVIQEIINLVDEQPKTDWIPFKQREADEEEKAHFLEHYGYELEYMLCGRLPDEDEEILVTYSNGCVGEDIFLRDGTECYLDSGQEIVTEAIAWMPKPQPYKKEGAE